jgi:RNA recognition motif-containing protein
MKVYVGNLSFETTDAQLNELAKAYGKPTSAQVAKDRATGQPRGFGFIEFDKDEEAKAAIAGLNGKDVNGRTLKVNEARPKGGRP